ncbi:MAG: signal peptidase II [Actinomycetota bacterium]|nr:MAG: signal peptidase II [Actinomycetota bacterium]
MAPFVRSPRIVVAFVAICVIIIDQITKSLAESNLASHAVKLVGPLSLQLVYNSGVAFSIGAGNTLLVTIVELLIIIGIILYVRRIKTAGIAVGFGLVIGGALGNIADRLFRHNGGSVIDFIHTGFWPTFNLADSAVVIGIVVILLGSRSRRERII